MASKTRIRPMLMRRQKLADFVVLSLVLLGWSRLPGRGGAGWISTVQLRCGLGLAGGGPKKSGRGKEDLAEIEIRKHDAGFMQAGVADVRVSSCSVRSVMYSHPSTHLVAHLRCRP